MNSKTLFAVLLSILSLVQAECPNGWTVFDGSCYLFSNKSISFIEANSKCSLLHGHIVNIGSQSENSFIKSFLSALKDNHYWIGLNDIAIENVWVWENTNTKGSFTDWDPSQPQGGTSENCAIIHEQGRQWHDVPCGVNNYFICEKPQHGETEIIG